MKKILFVLVMVMSMSVMAVNAQATKKSSDMEKKVDKTTTTTTRAAKNAATSAAMTVADLPKAVSDNIEKSYPGYAVKEVKSANGKNGADYKVTIEKGTAKKTLLYDKEGKIVVPKEEKSSKKSSVK